RVAHYAPLVGVDYGRITIRNQKTRWGSCSSQGNLNFNCLLMLFPDEVIDSVVVHELCHRKHMNHSAKFYKEVERVFPEYRKWHQWLNENGKV
ncbi:MAG: M48 family metallopeptidase, partial [Firmicutes bacterium]|nr:M48 family metallopeptidase [Bacillota bacterium]